MPTSGYKFFVTEAKAERFIKLFIPEAFRGSVESMKAQSDSLNSVTACISFIRSGVATHVRFYGSTGSDHPYMTVAVEYVRESFSDKDIRKEFAMTEKAGGQACEILKKNESATDQI